MLIVVLGLSIRSTWGNGHAVTYRALLGALARRGHRVVFLERDVPWYAENQDGELPREVEVRTYRSVDALARQEQLMAEADLAVVGSYVPDGREVVNRVQQAAAGHSAFYDIDTPVTLAGLESGNCAYLAPEQVPSFDLYLSFSAGRAIEILRQRWAARRVVPLHCTFDAAVHRPERRTLRWDLGYLGTYSVDRQPGLERLLIEPARLNPSRSFVVAGSQYPPELRWAPNVERIGHVPWREHARFYCSGRFTLNLTRFEMAQLGSSPSVRLFEAAACAVPVISDEWPGLEDYFEPGREILTATGADDVISILEQVGPEEARRVGERARCRVLEEHTPDHRARELERAVERLSGPRVTSVS